MKIELASSKDINTILTILEKRCIWMESNNINQWKSNSYTVSFNVDYFKEQIEKKRVYVDKLKAIQILKKTNLLLVLANLLFSFY